MLLVCSILGLGERTAYTMSDHGSRPNSPANNTRKRRKDINKKTQSQNSKPNTRCTSFTNGRLLHSAPDTKNQSQQLRYSTSITKTDCYRYSNFPPYSICPVNALRATRHSDRRGRTCHRTTTSSSSDDEQIRVLQNNTNRNTTWTDRDGRIVPV